MTNALMAPCVPKSAATMISRASPAARLTAVQIAKIAVERPRLTRWGRARGTAFVAGVVVIAVRTGPVQASQLIARRPGGRRSSGRLEGLDVLSRLGSGGCAAWVTSTGGRSSSAYPATVAVRRSRENFVCAPGRRGIRAPWRTKRWRRLRRLVGRPAGEHGHRELGQSTAG